MIHWYKTNAAPTTLLSSLLLLKDPWPQSCPTTNSAQNIVPCANQYAGQTKGLFTASAPAARPATTRKSHARYESDFTAFFLKHLAGIAFRISASVNGGGVAKSKGAFISAVDFKTQCSTGQIRKKTVETKRGYTKNMGFSSTRQAFISGTFWSTNASFRVAPIAVLGRLFQIPGIHHRRADRSIQVHGERPEFEHGKMINFHHPRNTLGT